MRVFGASSPHCLMDVVSVGYCGTSFCSDARLSLLPDSGTGTVSLCRDGFPWRGPGSALGMRSGCLGSWCWEEAQQDALAGCWCWHTPGTLSIPVMWCSRALWLGVCHTACGNWKALCKNAGGDDACVDTAFLVPCTLRVSPPPHLLFTEALCSHCSIPGLASTSLPCQEPFPVSALPAGPLQGGCDGSGGVWCSSLSSSVTVIWADTSIVLP